MADLWSRAARTAAHPARHARRVAFVRSVDSGRVPVSTGAEEGRHRQWCRRNGIVAREGGRWVVTAFGERFLAANTPADDLD